MAKYIDADRLRAEIKKRLKNVRDYMNGGGMKYKGPRYYKMQGKESAYDALLNIIDSLQQEQPEVDLKKEIDRELDTRWKGEYLSTSKFRESARHFFNLGLNARKEE